MSNEKDNLQGLHIGLVWVRLSFFFVFFVVLLFFVPFSSKFQFWTIRVLKRSAGGCIGGEGEC